MAYRIEFAPSARHQLQKLPSEIRVRVAAVLSALSTEPRPRGVRKLSGEESLYRIRVGDYRVIYQIRDKELIVLVLKIGHRREVYRQ
ncbi:MAG: type II toxin-antitoxin system RelE/ParE family toxin [Acidobacteria bacterium]|nr:type II toxin-antitoxin system RelE/ParE family toxin [Acidobacteriota bacterium]